MNSDKQQQQLEEILTLQAIGNNNIYSDKSLGLWDINDIRLLDYKLYER